MGRIERYVIVSAITAVSLFLIWYFSSIVLYIIVSFVLSLLGKPLMDLISNVKIKDKFVPRWIGATTVLLLFFGAFILIIDIIIPVIFSKFSIFQNSHLIDFNTIVRTPIQKINDFIALYASDEFLLHTEDIVSGISSRFSSLLQTTLSNIGSLIDFATNAIVASFSIFFITFFFLKENSLFVDGLTSVFPLKYEQRIRTSVASSIKLLSKYFLGLLMESTIKFIIVTVGFYIFGLDFNTSMIIALISAVLNVIPYIGPLIGAVVGTLIAVSVFSGSLESLMIFSISIFSIFQIFDNVILQPYIYSTSVKAHPLEIFIVILMAGSVAGVWGMLLAIPVYTTLRVFAREFFNNLRVVRKLTDSIDK